MVGWADFFQKNNIDDRTKMNKALEAVVSLGRMYPPTLPEVIHAYHGDLKKLNDHELIQYSFYIQSKFEYRPPAGIPVKKGHV